MDARNRWLAHALGESDFSTTARAKTPLTAKTSNNAPDSGGLCSKNSFCKCISKNLENIQERAATLIIDLGLNEDDALAFAYLYEMNAPEGITPTSWQKVQQSVGLGLDELFNVMEGRI